MQQNSKYKLSHNEMFNQTYTSFRQKGPNKYERHEPNINPNLTKSNHKSTSCLYSLSDEVLV